MQNLLKKSLKAKFKNEERVALLGVGSELRADDAAGMLVAKKLKEKCGNKRARFKVFFGETAPENLTGEIRKYKPDLLLIIDCANLGKKPGAISVLSSEQIAGMSFSTHTLPLNMMVLYLLDSIKCDVAIIGIQPKSLEFGKKMSPAVIKAVAHVSKILGDILGDGVKIIK